MKTILYATDYSQNSVPALRLAHRLAKLFEAKLMVMHVFDTPISIASTVSLTSMNKEKKLFVEHRAKLKAFVNIHLGDKREEVSISFIVEENGTIRNAILEKATKFDADVVVVGTKGVSPLREFLLGSTTKALIRNASCMVLAVPPQFKAHNLKTFVYASAFEQADIFAITRLVRIAKVFDAQIKIIHITTQNEYAGDQQMEWFKEMLQQKVTYEKLHFDLIFSDAIFEELNEYLNVTEADLLAMLERKDATLLGKYLQKDLVNKMVTEITVPLLSFNVGGL